MITFELRRRAFLTIFSVATTLLLSAANAQTSTYPDKPVRIVVPFPPGGAADIFARLIGQKYSELWGGKQTVIIDNRAGASGIIGTDSTAKSTADGYTLLMVTIGHAVNPFMFSKLPYDTKKDFTPVGVIANVPSIVVTSPSSDVKTFKDLLATAKTKPNALTFATSGIGTTSHIGAALMESMANVDMLHVPYKGAAPALQDVMGGRVDVSVDIILSSLQLVQSNKLKALAITSAKRSPMLPDVPLWLKRAYPAMTLPLGTCCLLPLECLHLFLLG
jgi:tripartite-type tricarboxylate transporter receptor subunit TctC